MFTENIRLTTRRWAKITVPNLSLWLHQFALLHRSGVDMVRALEILADQEPNPRLKWVTESIKERVFEAGVPVSSAAALYPKVFPPQVLLLMETGEHTGDFGARLEQAAQLLDSQHALENRVRQSLTVPCITMGVCLSLVFLVVKLIFPKFLGLYESMHVTLPPISLAVIFIIHVMDHPLFMAGLVLTGISAWIQREQLKQALMNLLLANKYTRVVVGQILATAFCDVIARLYQDGVALTVGLDLLARTTPFRRHARLLQEVNTRFKSDGMLTKAVKVIPYFPRIVGEMLVVGEESGELTQSLLSAARLLDTENQDILQRVVSLIEPVTMFLVGGIMTFFVVGLFLPIYQLITLVQK